MFKYECKAFTNIRHIHRGSLYGSGIGTLAGGTSVLEKNRTKVYYFLVPRIVGLIKVNVAQLPDTVSSNGSFLLVNTGQGLIKKVKLFFDPSKYIAHRRNLEIHANVTLVVGVVCKNENRMSGITRQSR